MEENTAKINKFAQEQIDQIANKCQQIQPLVVVRCITYNHEPYIRDALDGFVMQKTTFPFVAIVHDDASTDDTAAIIREYAEKYPDIIFPIFETENQYSKYNGSLIGIVGNACNATGAKYIAMCEGDDYWIDPLKLQKQVDFLEKNPVYGMVYSDFNVLDQKTGIIYPSQFKINPDKYKKIYHTVESFILKRGYVAPPSWLFRYDLWPDSLLSSIDVTFVLFTHFLAVTKVHVFDDTMVTYRKLEESASHTKDVNKALTREENLLKTQLKLIDKYNLDKELKLIVTETHYKTILAYAIANRRKDIIEKAKNEIKNKSFRDNLLFLIDKTAPCLLKLAYKIRDIK